MAYLKGGSVVDGNLYVEGGLIVRNITTSSGSGGQLPTIDDDCAKGSYLVKFDNDQGALKYTTLREDIDLEKLNDEDTETSVSVISNDKSKFRFRLNGRTDEENVSSEVLSANFDGSKIYLDINSYPLNISVKAPSNVYMMIQGIKTEVSDFFLEFMPVNLLPENAPTEFCY